jgi:hypothetical protein
VRHRRESLLIIEVGVVAERGVFGFFAFGIVLIFVAGELIVPFFFEVIIEFVVEVVIVEIVERVGADGFVRDRAADDGIGGSNSLSELISKVISSFPQVHKPARTICRRRGESALKIEELRGVAPNFEALMGRLSRIDCQGLARRAKLGENGRANSQLYYRRRLVTPRKAKKV